MVIKGISCFIKITVGILVLCFCQITNQEHSSNISTVYINYEELEKEKECIAEALWYEARGINEEGMRAVLSVIHNRKEAKGFPSTYCKVIWQSKQFSYRNHLQPGLKAIIRPVNASELPAYRQVYALASDAVYGGFKPILEPDVLWYHTGAVKPKWSRVKEFVINLSGHNFYKRKG